MTNFAQYLNVARVCAIRYVRRVMVFVMALKIIFASALFALSALTHHLFYCFPGAVRTLATAALPVWMVTTFWHRKFASALNRAILAGSASTFSYLKLFAARFANTTYKRFEFFGFGFIRTFFGTRVCGSSYMRVWSCKLFAANATNKSSMTSTFNGSLEFSHG